jgi:hypothetical protein
VKANIKKALLKAKGSGNLARIERTVDGEDMEWAEGFILDYSAGFVLLHRMDDRILLDGYEILRIEDIVDIAQPVPSQAFKHRALELRGQRGQLPAGLDLSSHKTIFQSVSARYPLVVIYEEMDDPELCEIGKIRAAGDKSCFLDEIDQEAEWIDEVFEVPYEDITRICFDGAYEQALALVAGMYPWPNKQGR